jgi:hypothetical protein
MRTDRITQRIVGSHITQAVSSAVVPITLNSAAKGVYVQAIGADVRYTLDGTAPAAGATGFLLYDKHPPTLIDLPGNTTLNFIRNASTDATVAMQYVGDLS